MSRRILPAIALSIWGVGLCAWLWQRTGEILGDFGNELYVAWQISQGKVFGRDIVYLYGPLSPWINGLAMRLFGASLNVILAVNLLVLLVVVLLLYDLMRWASSEAAALASAAFFLAVFAVSSGTRVTNYNFLTPYAHGMTHGLLLCLGTVWCLRRWFCGEGLHWAAAAAVLTGLSFLTKPEMFVGCALTFAAGFFGAARRREVNGPLIAAVLVGMAVGPLAEWSVLHSLSAGWQFATPGQIVASPMHVAGLGLDDVGNSFRKIGLSAAVDAAALGMVSVVSMKVKNAFIATTVSAAMFAAVVAAGQEIPQYWLDADRALVLVALGAALAFGWRLLAGVPEESEGQRRWAQWVLSVLSLSLLAKMFLDVRTYHYGFVLAAPTAMLGVAAMIDWLPSAIGRCGGSARTARLLSIGLLCGLALNRMVLTGRVLSERTLEVPLVFGGSLHARPLEGPVAGAVAWLKMLPASTTVGIYPDAPGIGFAAGRSSGVPYSVLNPMAVGMWGQENALRSMTANPPEVILIVRMDGGALGAHWFGEDYARDVMDWIRGRYEPSQMFGESGAERWISVWSRKERRE